MNNKIGTLLLATLIICGCSNKQDNTEKAVKVDVITAGESAATDRQSYTATIEELAGTALSMPTGGTLKTLAVDEGQMVRQGQLIAVTDGTTARNGVEVAHQATLQAKDALNQAQDAYRRMKMLHDNGSLPEMQWVEIQTKLSQAKGMVRQAQASEQIARKGLSDSRLYAPFSGYISQKTAEIGQNVLPGQPIVKLVKIDKVKCKMSVPEEEIDRIHTGDKVLVKVSALGDKTFWGTVSEKAVSADPLSRSYDVKAVINNGNHQLLPGMIAVASLSSSPSTVGRGASIYVPSEIIQIDEHNNHFVWTVRNGKAHKTIVTTGDMKGDDIEIENGIEPGTQVITNGAQKVSEGMKVELGVRN